MLTVMLLTIVVYIYTVIAFNFFRKFYIQEEDDEVDKKCHDMLTVGIMKCLLNIRNNKENKEIKTILFSFSVSFFICTKG